MKRNNLIGIILQTLLNEYNAGACDNMSEEQMQSISKQLNYIRLEIGNYQEKVLTTEEKQAIEIEKLKKELERSKMVIEVLKKNIEIQKRMERDSRLLNKRTNTKR